jgi:tRNA 2-thiouridine synthesizing protein A
VESAPPGTVVRLIADDPMARVDAPHFAAQAGLKVLSVVEFEGRLEIRVRTPGPGRRRAVGETTRRQRTN